MNKCRPPQDPPALGPLTVFGECHHPLMGCIAALSIEEILVGGTRFELVTPAV